MMMWNRLPIAFKEEGIARVEVTIVAVISTFVWIHSYSPEPSSTVNGFFWPVLGPLIISLRYGFVKGFICALITIAGVACVMKVTGTLNVFPFSLAVGMLLAVMISGEFRDYWHRSTQKYVLAHKTMSQQLDSFTKNYHLLKVSHDQLEQRTAGQIISLRSEINTLQNLAAKHADRRFESLAEPLLNLLANIGGIQVAGLYKVTNNRIETTSYAILGDQHQLKTKDPMLLDMLTNKKLLSPATLGTDEEHKSRYQLCIPLLDTGGTLQAFVLAESVKFFSLTPTNIALLSLVADNAADLLSSELLTPILESHQANLFTHYLQRALYNKRHYGADSSLVIFVDTTGTHEEVLKSIVNYRRGTDVYWTCSSPENYPRLIVLLPLITTFDTSQYIKRVEDYLIDSIGEEMEDIDILGPFSFDKDQDEINRLIDELGANDEKMAVPTDNNL